MPRRPRRFIPSVSCRHAVLSSRCWARLCRGAGLGAHWNPAWDVSTHGAGWQPPAPLLHCNASIPGDPRSWSPIPSVRWRPGKPGPASAPALCSKLAFLSSFSPFQTTRVGRLGVIFHAMSMDNPATAAADAPLSAPKRHNITDPGDGRARGPLDDPAAPSRGRFPGLVSPLARASGFCWRFVIPPIFRYRFIYFYLEEQRKVWRCSLSSLERGRIVRALKRGLCQGSPQPLPEPSSLSPGSAPWGQLSGQGSRGCTSRAGRGARGVTGDPSYSP